MSDTILHPIIHGRKLSQFMTQEQANSSRDNFEQASKASMATMATYLEQGYTVIDSWDSEHGDYQVRQMLIYKADDSAVTAQNWRTEMLHNVEVKTTFSKTHDEYFSFLRCSFRSNQFVNIFDHPDISRNTWKIAQERGWTWERLQDALMNGYPVAATLSYDGQWFSLIDIIDAHEYDIISEIIDTMNGAKDDEEE